jgi:hypothetical protein
VADSVAKVGRKGCRRNLCSAAHRVLNLPSDLKVADGINVAAGAARNTFATVLALGGLQATPDFGPLGAA